MTTWGNKELVTKCALLFGILDLIKGIREIKEIQQSVNFNDNVSVLSVSCDKCATVISGSLQGEPGVGGLGCTRNRFIITAFL